MSFKDFLLGLPEEENRKPVKIGGATFYVREMSGAERDDWESAQVEANKEGEALVNFRARFLSRVLINEAGEQVVKTPEEAELLGKRPAREILKAFDLATKLNAVTPEDVNELAKK